MDELSLNMLELYARNARQATDIDAKIEWLKLLHKTVHELLGC